MLVLGAAALAAGLWVGLVLPRNLAPEQSSSVDLGPSPTEPPRAAPATPRPGFGPLETTVQQLLSDAGATGGVTITELGGPSPQSWSYDGDQQFTAASTYKLPLLMEEAQNITGGHAQRSDQVCVQDGDIEDGWFGDYDSGTCMPRSQLDSRVGKQSDNTAARMLVRVNGGSDALNSYASHHGAGESDFFDPNTTTTSDLARLWVDEAMGRAGGKPAQRYLYPLLTRTAYEDGIPAGVPKGTVVVHKIGALDDVTNDAALVPRGPKGAYVLVICTSGTGGDAGWKVLADISRAVWQFEASR